MNPRLSAWLSARLIDRRAGHRQQVLRAYRSLSALDVVSRKDARAHRDAALARLLRHAFRHVPFFADHTSSVDRVSTENASDLLAGLPIMRRGAIQENPEAFTAKEHAGGVSEDFTGGSTGTPMRFVVDPGTQVAREASLMWADHLAGWQYGDRIAMLWGSDRDVASATAHLRASLRWWMENRRWYNAFDMDEARMRTYHRALTRFQPHLIVTYAGTGEVFSEFLRSSGRSPSYPLKAIVSSAEMLTPGARATMESAFQRPVFDRYGNREVGAIAAECEAHAGLHINEGDVVVEIDSPDPANTPGPILLTYLRNFAMPFIRYDSGDLGIMEEDARCPCGRRTRRLARIAGRQSDTIRTASGKLIHGEYFTHLLYGENVREFQFVQVDAHRYTLRVVGVPDSTGEQAQRLEERFSEVLGPGASFTLEYTNAIPTLPSGKRKFTISLLDESRGTSTGDVTTRDQR